MIRPADVVVVGGGIIGAAIAYECARHRLGRVVLLDKAPGPGEGSTGASSSICRTRYSNTDVVRLAVNGLGAYRNWNEYLGSPEARARFVETGVLWIADRPDPDGEIHRLRAAGASAVWLDEGDLTARFPGVSSCVAPVDLDTDHECRSGSGFLFEDRAGYVDPTAALGDLLDGSAALGVDVRFGAQVTSITRIGGRVGRVGLADGTTLDAGVVVNAAGPWCNRINAMAGVEHRWTFTPTRIQTIHHPAPPPIDSFPVVVDLPSGLYVRPDRGTATLWAGSVREEDEREAVANPDEYARTPNVAFRDQILTVLQHRLPDLVPHGRVPGIAGLYTINRQDVHPVIGPSGVDGLWMANGFSGHGFKLAPAIGSMVAQGLGGARLEFDTSVPLGLLAIDRTPLGVDAKNVLA